MKCANCGREIAPNHRFCASCGKPAVVARYCARCGSQLESVAAFCPRCGAAQTNVPAPKAPAGQAQQPAAASRPETPAPAARQPATQPKQPATPVPPQAPPMPDVQPKPQTKSPMRWGRLLAGLGLIAAAVIVFFVWETEEEPAGITISQQGGILELEGLRVELGAGSLPAGARVTAQRLTGVEKRYPNNISMRLAGPVFGVELPQGEALARTVKVTIPYDPTRLRNPADTSRLSGATWDGRTWERKPSIVDTTNKTVSFTVDDFCAIGPIEYDEPDSQYRVLETGRFKIKFRTEINILKPLAAPLYVSPPALGNIDTATAPAFVKDLGFFLEDAYERIRLMGYTMPATDPKIEIIVDDLDPPGLIDAFKDYAFGQSKTSAVNGKTGPSGPIYIDNQLEDPDGALRPPAEVWKRLKATAGHELFHVVQRQGPGFPTWFYETGAVFMEWKLYGQELPFNMADEHLTGQFGRPQFFFGGLFSGGVTDHYAKSAFLIYLQQVYGKNCSGPGKDIVKDGIFPSGSRWTGMATANFQVPDMSGALLGAAKACGGYTGTWRDLLEEFAQRYYIEWDKWPGYTALLTGSGGAPGPLTRSTPLNYYSLDFGWKAGNNPGPQKFPEYRWPPSSGAMWSISGEANQKDLFGTLVLRVDAFSDPLQVPGQGLASPFSPEAPRFAVYSFGHDKATLVGKVAPAIFPADNPTVAIYRFGNKEGGLVGEVDLVGVDGRDAGATWLGRLSQLQAYLLPEPKGVSVQQVEVDEGGKKVDKLRVSWAVDARWVSADISKQFGGFAHEVRVSASAEDPKGKVAATVPVDKGNSVEISLQPGMRTIRVVLVDKYKNEGPPGLANAPAPPPVVKKPLPEVMKAALGRLGYKWTEAGGLPLTGGFTNSEAKAGSYLQCTVDGCVYQLVFPTHQEYNQPGKMGIDGLELQIGALATPAEAQEYFKGEQDKDFKTSSYRGLAAASLERDESGGSPQEGWGWGSQRIMLVTAGNVVVKAGRTASCGTVAAENICGGARTVEMPAKEIDALLEEAVRGGFIPAESLK